MDVDTRKQEYWGSSQNAVQAQDFDSQTLSCGDIRVVVVRDPGISIYFYKAQNQISSVGWQNYLRNYCLVNPVQLLQESLVETVFDKSMRSVSAWSMLLQEVGFSCLIF